MVLGIFILLGIFGFYLVVLPILVFTARGRVTRLESEIGALTRELALLRHTPATAADRPVAAAAAATPPPHPVVPGVAPVPVAAAGAAPVPSVPPMAGVPDQTRAPALEAPLASPGLTPSSAPARPAEAARPIPTVLPQPATAGERATAPPVAATPAAVPALPASTAPHAAPAPSGAPPAPSSATPSATAPASAAPSSAAPPVGATPTAAPAGAVPPPRPPMAPPPAPPRPPGPPKSGGGGFGALRGFNWESLVGVKLFSAIAGIALLLAAVFFLRFSVEHGWLQPPVRVAIGVTVAIALLIACELRVANKYRVTANAMDAAAIAMLFSTFFAAHALWNLIPTWLTFVLLVIVTALAVLLSVRRASVFIAVLGLLGGFAAPAMLSSGQNNPLGLFGYLLLLNAGLAWVAHTKRWPILTGLTLVFTTIYQWGWVIKFLNAASLPMAAGIFLIFPLLTLFVTTIGERYRDGGGANGPRGPDGTPVPGGTPMSRIFGDTPGVSAMLPFLLATYLAAVPQYGGHYGVLFGFLFCIDIGLFVVALMRRAAVLHLVGGATTLMVFAVWFALSYGDVAWPVVLLIVSAFALLYLAMPVAATWFNRPVEGPAARAVFTAPLLLAAFPLLLVIEPMTAAPLLPFGVLALLLIAMATYAVARAEGAVYFVAAFLAIGAEFLWSARYLSPARLHTGLVVYFLFALIFIAVPSVARRFDRDLRPRGAGGLLVLASLLLAFFLTPPAIGHLSLWGLAGLIGVVLAGLAFEARASNRQWLVPIGALVAWLALWFWWGMADGTVVLLPALAVITGVALLTMGIAVWLRPQVDEQIGKGAAPADANLALSLIGHVFLFVIATNAGLSMPPWPLFAVLFVLDLALSAAALHQRRAQLHVAGMVASAVVLFTWSLAIDDRPWPIVAVIVALALPAYAILMARLATRVAFVLRGFLVAIAVCVVGGQLIMISAAAAKEIPPVFLLIAANVVLLGTILALAARERWERLVWLPLVTTTLAMFMWQDSPAIKAAWLLQLALPVAIYACFLAYPLLRGRGVGTSIEPHRAAVLASVPFFLLARHALIPGGFGPVIGALPVAQAILLLVLLVRLLRLEPPGARTLGRLALVAGAALAFITLAIPLQVDKQWLTVAWALEGAALAWLYGRIPHRGLLLASTGLLTVVFLRLAANPQVFVYAPRSSVRIWNWYLYAYLIAAASCFVAAWLLARTEDRLIKALPRVSYLLPAAGTVLLFLLLNIEIADFYATGPTLTFRFSATLAQDLTYTLGWGMFAIGLLIVGIRNRIRNARLASIGLLLITVFKCFLHDLGRLGGLYLVASFVGLAVCLALVALALQRFVLAEPAEPAESKEAV
jgi:hypothetical protein